MVEKNEVKVLEEKIKYLEEKLTTLITYREFSYYMGIEKDLDTIISSTAKVIANVISTKVCEFWLLKDNKYYFKSFITNHSDTKLIEQKEARKIFNEVIKNKYIEKVYGENNINAYTSIIPISDDIDNQGFIAILIDDDLDFNENKKEFFRMASKQLGIYVKNAYLYEKLKDAYRTDEMTGVYNRSYLNEYTKNISKEVLLSLGVIFIDIDNFKKANDRYGHAFGDKVLHELGEILKNKEEKYDCKVFRYGGEEFLVTCEGLSRKKLYELAEKIRKDFECTPVEFKNKTLHFTVSIGVASYGESTQILDFDKLVDCADIAMYYAKNNGKNAVEFASENAILYNFSKEKIKRTIARYKRYQTKITLVKVEIDCIVNYTNEIHVNYKKAIKLLNRESDSIIFGNSSNFLLYAENTDHADILEKRIHERFKLDEFLNAKFKIREISSHLIDDQQHKILQFLGIIKKT